MTRRNRDWMICAVWMGYMAFVFEGGWLDGFVAAAGGVFVLVSIARDVRDLRASR